MRARAVAGLVVVVALVFPAVAAAQNKAAAEAAFRQGKALMDAGQTAEACAAFQSSQQLDPQFGTQYNLALCYEALGKLASAYGEYLELAAKDTNQKRRARSKAKAAELEPRLTRLTLIVSEPPPELAITRDDVDVTVLVGVTTPVDPGVYTFTATAPGRQTWSQQVDLTAEGATITVEVPVLAAIEQPVDDPDDGGGDVPDPERPVIRDRPLPRGPEPARRGKGRTILALSVTGAGVVAAGVGLVFGAQAAGLRDDAEDACGGALDPCAGDVIAAQDAIDDARGKATLSTIFVGAGVAAIATGVVLWVTGPDDDDEVRAAVVPVVGAGGLGVALDGRF